MQRGGDHYGGLATASSSDSSVIWTAVRGPCSSEVDVEPTHKRHDGVFKTRTDGRVAADKPPDQPPGTRQIHASAPPPHRDV